MSIPSVFHFVFGLKKQTEPFHLMHYLCLESCLQVNDPDEIRFYYHHEPYGKYWAAIRDRITCVRVAPPKRISIFRYGLRNRDGWKYRYAHQSDYLRLDKLIEHGGVYADMDTLFLNPIQKRLFAEPFVLGQEGDVRCQRTGELRASLCNAFIMSERQSEFAVLWRQEMEEAFDGSWSRHSTFLPYDLSQRFPDLIHVEPARTFYKHMWTRQGIHTLFEGLDADFTEVSSFHLWSHLWWEESRRDFCDFHAGLLNEAYVREADTTYALAARRYLPGLE